MFNKDDYKEFKPAENETPKTETVTQASNGKPSDVSAPFGRDENGTPKAPYGHTVDRATGEKRVKRSPGRGMPGGVPRVSDEQRLIDDLKPPVQSPGISPPVTPGAPVSNVMQPQAPSYQVHVSGAMFIYAIDFLMPMTIAGLWNAVAPSKVNIDDLRMDAKERADLEKASDTVVQDILKGMTPMQQFLLCLGVIYGSKLTFAHKTPKVKKAPVKKVPVETSPEVKSEKEPATPKGKKKFPDPDKGII